ncbi:MAG TPA: sigma-70 family RNA polymerase sigma factor [Acidobacteriota bacterium]|nr:sigma-70 family RNA polymerase sigma factor [Acidobacteriota bacterium]
MEPMSGIDELYSLAHGGDAAARASLYARLLVCFRVIIRHRMWGDEDAEDVAQDALLAVVAKFDELTVESSFAAWAYRILHNKIVDHFRLKKIRTDKIRQLGQRRTGAVVSDPDPMLKVRIKTCFRKIHQTHRRHARILSLHFQGYTTDEICLRLGITRNNCWVTLSRARTMLEKCLSQEDEGS